MFIIILTEWKGFFFVCLSLVTHYSLCTILLSLLLHLVSRPPILLLIYHWTLNFKVLSPQAASYMKNWSTWVKYIWSAECKCDLVPTSRTDAGTESHQLILTRSFKWETHLALALCRTGWDWPGEGRPAPVTRALPSSGVNSIASYTAWEALNFIPRTRGSPRWVYSSRMTWLDFDLRKIIPALMWRMGKDGPIMWVVSRTSA